MKKIAALFPEDTAWVSRYSATDQAGFATAVEQLRRDGMKFQRLPEQYNVRWHHLFLRVLTCHDIRFFHAFGIGRKPVSSRCSVRLSLWFYPFYVWFRLLLLGVRERRKLHRMPSVFRQVLPSLLDAYRATSEFRMLYRKHMAPALKYSNVKRRKGMLC